MKNLKNWFKCNTVRYFALDNACGDDNKNQYVSSISDNPDIRHPSQSSTYSSTIWCECIYNISNRMDKKFDGYSENGNGLYTRKSHTGGRTPFFIEVRTHYRHLGNDVYTPLATLNTEFVRDGLTYPPWKKQFEIGGHIPANFLSNTAIRHLSEDNPQLLNEVRDYRLLFDQYQTKLNSLQRTIDCIIKNRFIQCSVYPTPSNNYHNLGC